MFKVKINYKIISKENVKNISGRKDRPYICKYLKLVNLRNLVPKTRTNLKKSVNINTYFFNHTVFKIILKMFIIDLLFIGIKHYFAKKFKTNRINPWLSCCMHIIIL